MTDLNRRQALAHLAVGTGAIALTAASCGSSRPSAELTNPTDASVASDSIDDSLDISADQDAPPAAADLPVADTTSVETPLSAADFGSDSCMVAPASTAGPYYFAVDQLRRDISEGKPGRPLRLGFRVMDENCDPIPDALVDIWHCDALGYYAGFPDADPDEGVPAEIIADEEETFMRGVQPTDREGIADFITVYPGFYRIRAVHIHVKVHLNDNELITTQTYLDDAVSDQVYATAPYNEREVRDLYNDDERATPEEVMDVTEVDGGYRATITLQVRRA